MARFAAKLADVRALKLEVIILIFTVSVALYHLIYNFVIFQGSGRHYVTHVGLMLGIVFLLVLRGKGIRSYISLVCLVLTSVGIIYFWLNFPRLEGEYEFITNLDFVIGILMVIVPLIATWLWWGPVIPIIVCLGILLFFLGHLLPMPFYHAYFTPKYCISFLTTSISTGLFGFLTPLSANLTFFFMMLGAILQEMGVLPSFVEIGKMISRVLRGGPSYTALIASSLVGMISGSGSGNVALTGSATIPAMQQAGFSDEDAGGIEAAASTGGQAVPPIMGAAAFIMAGFIGVPYLVIMSKAIIGALLFYLILFIGIFFLCYSKGMKHGVGKVDKEAILRRFPVFLIPLIVVIALLVQGVSARYACSYGIFAAVVTGLLLVAETRSPATIIKGLSKGAIMGAQIGVILFVCGMFAQVVVSTGLAPKASSAIMSLTAGELFSSLVLIAIVCIILGMGLPTSGAYIIVALLMVPSLLRIGVDIFAAHFFAFYYAIWGAVSPPVAPASLVASRLSGGSFWGTGLAGIRLMAILFVFPFVLVVHPSLLDFPFIAWQEVVIILVLLLTGVTWALAQYGWFFTKLTPISRGLCVLATFTLIGFLLDLGGIFLAIGLILTGVVMLQTFLRSIKRRPKK